MQNVIHTKLKTPSVYSLFQVHKHENCLYPNIEGDPKVNQEYNKVKEKLKSAWKESNPNSELFIEDLWQCHLEKHTSQETLYKQMEKEVRLRKRSEMGRLKISDSIHPGWNQSLQMAWDDNEFTKLLFLDINNCYLAVSTR